MCCVKTQNAVEYIISQLDVKRRDGQKLSQNAKVPLR